MTDPESDQPDGGDEEVIRRSVTAEELDALYTYRAQKVRAIAGSLAQLGRDYSDTLDSGALSLLSDVGSHLEYWARAYEEEQTLIQRGFTSSTDRVFHLRFGPDDAEPLQLLEQIVSAVEASREGSRIIPQADINAHLTRVAAGCRRYLDRAVPGRAIVHLSAGARSSAAMMEIVRTESLKIGQASA